MKVRHGCREYFRANIHLTDPNPTGNLRSASQFKLNLVYTPGTFQFSASRAFNCLPLNIRSGIEFKIHLTKNNTQTAVMNITDKRIVRKK